MAGVQFTVWNNTSFYIGHCRLYFHFLSNKWNPCWWKGQSHDLYQCKPSHSSTKPLRLLTSPPVYLVLLALWNLMNSAIWRLFLFNLQKHCLYVPFALGVQYLPPGWFPISKNNNKNSTVERVCKDRFLNSVTLLHVHIPTLKILYYTDLTEEDVFFNQGLKGRAISLSMKLLF